MEQQYWQVYSLVVDIDSVHDHNIAVRCRICVQVREAKNNDLDLQ